MKPHPPATIAWSILRLWVLISAFFSLCGWLLAATGHLDAAGYTVGFLCGGALLFRWARREFRGTSAPSLQGHFRILRWRRPLPLIFASLCLFICAGAAWYPPNNYDALTYRVPQIMEWITAGRWHWISNLDRHISITPPGYGWFMAPGVVFFKTDRLFAVPNVLAFFLLPGVFFSAARQCGVRGRVAWMWMWIVPTISCLAMQAGGMANDLLPAVYALAALALGLRARRSSEWADFWISALAAALTTGVKITAAPMVLPWLIATLPCWRSVPRHRLGAIATALVAITISYLPTAALNAHFTGSWKGDPNNTLKLEARSPMQAAAGNSLILLTGALEPSLCPFAQIANAQFRAFSTTHFANWIAAQFPRFNLTWGELATEESSGLGLAVFLLLVISLAGGALHGGPSLFQHRDPARWIRLSILAGFCAFLVKMGSEADARLAAPCYPFLIMVAVASRNQEWVTRQRWWRWLAVAVAASILPAAILSPARPLWPAQTVLGMVARVVPGNKIIQRAQTVFGVYERRHDYLAPLKAQLPAGARVLGVIPTTNDLEGTLWKPYGLRRVIEVQTASATDPALALLRGSGILTSQRALAERFQLTPESYAAIIQGKITASAMIAQKVSIGLERWVLISFEDP